MPSLYDVTIELQALYDIVESAEPDDDGELADVDKLLPSILSTEQKLSEKIDGYAAVIADMTAHQAILAMESDRLFMRAVRYKQCIARMKAHLLQAMMALGVKRVEGRIAVACRCVNGGLQPVITTGSPSNYPREYQRVSVDANNETIRDALLRGMELPFATLGPRGEHVRIQ